MTRLVLVAITALLALAIAGCGSGSPAPVTTVTVTASPQSEVTLSPGPSPAGASSSGAAGASISTTISGTGMQMDTDETTFNSNMSLTEALHVDGSLTVTARIDPTGDYPVVEGYLMPADAPDDPATYRDYSYVQFDLMPGLESQTFDDLHGDYYVVAGGQDCDWSLDVTN